MVIHVDNIQVCLFDDQYFRFEIFVLKYLFSSSVTWQWYCICFPRSFCVEHSVLHPCVGRFPKQRFLINILLFYNLDFVVDAARVLVLLRMFFHILDIYVCYLFQFIRICIR